MRAE
ncbi:hypothetical protein VCHENC02_0376A, partial [Vibrio harveyi]|jgi:hypothetical protein